MLGEDVLSESSRSPAAGPGLGWQPDAVLLLLLLLLLTGEAVLLPLVASDVGGDGHLLLTTDPRNNRVQEESWFFHYCSILRRFVSGIVPEPCQRLRFYESESQVRMASLIEQSADSSVASSMSEFKILKLYILPPLSPQE